MGNKGFLRHVVACNGFTGQGFQPFSVDGKQVGWLTGEFAARLLGWPEVFGRDREGGLALVCPALDFDGRSRVLADLFGELRDQGVVKRLHGEPYPVIAGCRNEVLFVIDRAAAPHFGIRAFGQHLNGYVRTDDGLRMWIARRARDRVNYPGCLDNLTAGGLPWGISLADNLLKECREEASIPVEIARQAVPTGTISYFALGKGGCKPDTMYCYDLELPADFTPRGNDGEVESFQLLPAQEVLEIVAGSDDFKLNCNLVVIDFAIRHGLIAPDHPEYLDLVTGLHRPLGRFAAPG